jgi:hypothetical protein
MEIKMMDNKDWSSYWRDSNPPLIARIGFNIEKKSIEKTFKKIIKTTHGLPLFIDTSIIIVLEKEKNKKRIL